MQGEFQVIVEQGEAMTDHTPITDEELAEMEARANAATAGPWVADVNERPYRQSPNYTIERQVVNSATGVPICSIWNRTKPYVKPKHVLAKDHVMLEEAIANARLIAEVRSDVPRLIAEVKRLREYQRDSQDRFVEVVRQRDEVERQLAVCHSTKADTPSST